MHTRTTTSISAALAALVLSASAAAHHSYAEFDRCTNVTIEGEIERILWSNPHIVLTVDAGDAGTFRVEWFDLLGLRRADLSTESLREGDHVVVTGARHRDPELKIVTLLSEVRPATGAWHWSRERTRPAGCGEHPA